MAWNPDYITAALLKADMGIAAADTLDDVQLGLDAAAACAAVNDHCRRQFGKVDQAEQRSYRLRWSGGRWVADIDDLGTDAGLVVTVAGLPVAGPVLEPENALLVGRVYTRLAFPALPSGVTVAAGTRLMVDVTAVWGWPAVPDAVVRAALLQGRRLADRRRAPFGIAGSPDQGSELRLLARVDPDVAVLLHGLVRPRRAVGG